MEGFEYPTEPHDRRHGPSGYDNYESYREWLRDEFTFRCVFCLHRERWYGRSGTFEIDHLEPVSTAPERKFDYTNLYYACDTCNSAKSNVLNVPDPCTVAFGECLRITEDGEVEALNAYGQKLRDVLRLNHPSNVDFRFRLMRTLRFLRDNHSDLYREHMAFPDDLPDLRRKRAKSNLRPEGADNCFFALRERNELPETY